MARLKVSEKDFSRQVIAFAHRFGWRVAHFHQARTAKGAWVTPVSADGKGFPDLVLVRERIIFAELKVGSNKLSQEQSDWLAAIVRTGAEMYVWRPDDLETIGAILYERRPSVSTVTLRP